MSTKKGTDKATALQRDQLVEAVRQGFLDSVLAADLATAATNGYVAGKIADAQI